MNYIDMFIILNGVLFAGWSFWYLSCNNRTYNERMEFLVRIADLKTHEDRIKAHEEFARVTYDDHYRAKFWLRDPWMLYTPFVRDMMK